MSRETRLSRDDLILPLFIVEGSGVREEVVSMPGVLRFSVDQVVDEAKRVFADAPSQQAAMRSMDLRGRQRRSFEKSKFRKNHLEIHIFLN